MLTHPYQLISDDNSFRSRPNIPHWTHKVHLLIVSTTQVKAQINTSYILNKSHQAYERQSTTLIYIYIYIYCFLSTLFNSHGINECLLHKRNTHLGVGFFHWAETQKKLFPLTCRGGKSRAKEGCVLGSNKSHIFLNDSIIEL